MVTGPNRDGAGENVGELVALYVRPQLWGLGVGGWRHATGVDVLTGRFAEATLWILRSNRRARSFYERRGWLPDGLSRQEAVGGVSVVEIRYRRPLRRPDPSL